ncbi:MAG: hypothetical protein AAF755_03455 [Pseudomonadota bacterium]
MDARAGYRVYPLHPETKRWATAAHEVALDLVADPEKRVANLRHGDTWFVGVDALPNAPDGRVDNVPLAGPWADHITRPRHWHQAQLSIVYPGYPQQDPDESDANHRFRIKRAAAHVDGLLPVGPQRRRYLKEPHSFILGLPLTQTSAATLTVWPGSHHLLGAVFRRALAGGTASEIDLTEVYQQARHKLFDRIAPVRIVAAPGQAILLHRHLLHGVSPWREGDHAPPEGRMIAYFRPLCSVEAWLAED